MNIIKINNKVQINNMIYLIKCSNKNGTNTKHEMNKVIQKNYINIDFSRILAKLSLQISNLKQKSNLDPEMKYWMNCNNNGNI